MGSDGARVTLPVEKGKRGARTICRSELARDLLILESRSQPSCLGSDYRMWRGRKKLCVVYDCFAAGRSLAVLVNGYGGRGARKFVGASLPRDLLILESRSQPSCLGSDYRMWRGRKKLCVVYDCFAAGRSLAVLVNCYGGRARRSFGRSCRRLRSFLQAKKKTLIIKVFLKMVPRGGLYQPSNNGAFSMIFSRGIQEGIQGCKH